MAGTKEHSGGVREGAGSGGAREGAGRKSKQRVYKTRNWATIIYPDSEKPGWRDVLRNWCVQAFVSPLHDSDSNPDDTAKKPHYHVLMMWDGPKSKELMEKRVEELGGVGCQPCNSSRGYARYLCHLDNPEKAQYDVGAVEAFGGADYLEVIQLESDRRQTISEMCDWCRETGCVSFAALCDYARRHRPVWWQAITAHSTMVMFRYVRALEDEVKNGRQFAGNMLPGDVSPVEAAALKVELAEEALREAKSRLEEAKAKAKAKASDASPALPGSRPEGGAHAEGGRPET